MSKEFSYDVSISPNPLDLTISVKVKDGEKKTDPPNIAITVTDAPSVDLGLKPRGNWVQKILSGILWPIARLMTATNKDSIKNALESKEHDVAGTTTLKKDGFSITPTLGALGGFKSGDTQWVQITGELSLTADET